MVSYKGIEEYLDKIQAILDMKPPRSIKKVQSLTGRVAALNRFVSKTTDLKIYLTTAPLLSSFMLREELYLYLAVTPYVVSSVLIREEGRVQKPVYYTSRALKGIEGRYPLIEKLAFALITASRKLRHYF